MEPIPPAVLRDAQRAALETPIIMEWHGQFKLDHPVDIDSCQAVT